MNLKDYLTEDRILVLQGSTKTEILAELAEKISQNGSIKTSDLLAAVNEREKLMSTGIGHGLAVPHVRLKKLRQLKVALGVCPTGVSDYVSLDDEPVKIIVMIAAPDGQHEAYIKLLAKVVESLKQEKVRKTIQQAKTASEIYDILTG